MSLDMLLLLPPGYGFDASGVTEIQRITYTADGGQWIVKAGGNNLAHNISANDLATEIGAQYSACTVQRTVNSNQYQFDVTFTATGNEAEMVPVDVSLYTSAAENGSLTVTTQGATEAVEEFNVFSTLDGGAAAFDLVFDEGTAPITFVDGATSGPDIQGMIDGANVPATVSAFNSGGSLSFHVAYNSAGAKTDVTVSNVSAGSPSLSDYVQGADGIAEVTEIHRGSANAGQLVVSGATLDYDDSNSDVASAVGTATSRTFTAGSGDGSSGNPWILTDTATGTRADLAIDSDTLEVRTSSAGTLAITTVRQGS